MNAALGIDVKATGTAQAAGQVDTLATSVHGVGTATEETSQKTSALRKTLSGLATGFAIYKGAQYIKSAVTETTSLAKATVGLTRLTGMDTKTASAWVGIAEERGLSAKQLNTGFITLSRQLVSLSQGSKSATTAFASLGLTQKQLQGKSTQQALDLVADSLHKLPAGADKAAMAQKLLGRSAQQLLPVLNQGSGALNEQVGAMAKHLGMTGDTVKGSLELVKAQREWEATSMGLKIAIATALLPIITQLAAIIEPIAQGFADLMRSSKAFQVIVISLTAALTTYIGITKLAALAGFTLEGSMIWIAAIPAIIIGVGVALVILYKKVGWFRDGVNAAWSVIKSTASAVFDFVKKHWALLLDVMTGGLAGPVIFIVQHFGQIKSAATAAFDAIKSAVSVVAHIVTTVLGAAFSAVSHTIQTIVSGITDVINGAKKIANLPGKALHVITGGLSSAAGFLGIGQHGLYASHSGTALVGEHGPELVHLPQGSSVRPFGGLSGGGGGAVQVHTHVYLGKRQIALAIGDYVADQQAAR